MASIQQAREALGGRLREIRKRTPGLTGAVLAERLGWVPSKVSKLENGRQTPSEADLTAWCEACGATAVEELPALLASLRTLEARHAEWVRLLRGGARGHQDSITAINAATRVFLAFETAVVPGLLQTGGYARAVFAELISALNLPNDIDAAVAARLASQEVLYDASKRFHIVVTEAALRYRLCPPEVMMAQLDRLISATTLPNVRFGVISNRTSYTRIPSHGFWIHDDTMVLVETFTAELNLAQPHEIETYTAAFRRFADLASYKSAARAIIAAIMDELRAEYGHLDDEPDEG